MIIFAIERQVLRIDVTTSIKMKVWCGNGENKGYTKDYKIAEKICKELNKNNKSKNVRYVIREFEEII